MRGSIEKLVGRWPRRYVANAPPMVRNAALVDLHDDLKHPFPFGIEQLVRLAGHAEYR